MTNDQATSGVSRGLPARLEQVAGASEQWAGYGEKTLTMSHGELAKLLREAAETITRISTERDELREQAQLYINQREMTLSAKREAEARAEAAEARVAQLTEWHEAAEEECAEAAETIKTLRAAVAALPRYVEEDVRRRPSMYEYVDAEALDEALAGLRPPLGRTGMSPTSVNANA